MNKRYLRVTDSGTLLFFLMVIVGIRILSSSYNTIANHFVVLWPTQLQVCRRILCAYCGLPMNVTFFGPAAVALIFGTRNWSNGHRKSTRITQHVYSSWLAAKTIYCAIVWSRPATSILLNANSRQKTQSNYVDRRQAAFKLLPPENFKTNLESGFKHV